MRHSHVLSSPSHLFLWITHMASCVESKCSVATCPDHHKCPLQILRGTHWAHQMWHGSHANAQQMKEYAASQECLIQPLLLFYFNTSLNYTDLLAHTRAGQSDHFVSRLSLKTSTINTFQVNFWSWPFVSYKCVLFSIYSICVAFSCQDLPKLLTC